MVGARLPGMSAGLLLPKNKKQWKEYMVANGGDFRRGTLLGLLVRSNGKSRTPYDDRARADLVTRNATLSRRFYAVFPTFEVLRGRMSTLKLEWPEWWS